ncbi:hypothetical protein VTN31DRAFT_5028 [Thermomyces dupontii]|uniref:uncharacterized protein n=1 Tax=Talaromyces thermophilus TaxID=28565 RepID=UPI003742F082
MVSQVRRVAVIGAGPSGLVAVKYLLAEKYFEQIDVFEQNSRVGGVWIHTNADDKNRLEIPIPQISPDVPLNEPIWHEKESGRREASFVSPMYSGLETNIPKSLMEFVDQQFDDDVQLFPRSDQILDYLERYADDIGHLIRLEHQVQSVALHDPSRSNWKVTVKNLQTGQTTSQVYDAVVAANGHYDVPYVPAIPGIEAWNQAYPGSIIHSKKYDSPKEFKDKKVIVVGNLASGLDIGLQLSPIVQQPLLSSSKGPSAFFPGGVPPGRTERGEIVEFLPPGSAHRAVRFADNTVEEGIDTIVFCTGYLYSYPFLEPLDPPVVTDGSRTLNVYQQLFYNEHPTLVFPVLPQRVTPFPLVENQAAVFARVWSGRLSLPSKEEMRAWEEAEVSSRGSHKGFHVIPYPLDAEYLNYLYDWAEQAARRPGLENDGQGKKGVRWGPREKWMRSHFGEIKFSYRILGEKRHSARSLKDIGIDLEERVKSEFGETIS